MQGGVRPRLRSLGLAVASLLAALLLFEVVLRASGFSFSFAPERVEFGWPNPVILKERFESDPDLFWVSKDYSEMVASLAGSRPDVVFLGDSTTEKGSYPEIFLAGAGTRRPNQPVTGGKLGVSGWSTYQGREQLERDVVPLRPRYVTIYFGWNDHWVGFAMEDKDVHAITRSPLAGLQDLRLGQLLTKAHYALRTRGRQLVAQRVAPDDFADNLRAIARTARENDIVPVLITAPTSHRRGHEPEYLAQRWLKDLSELVPLHRRYVAIVREVAQEQDVALCDLARFFDELPAAVVRDEYFMSDGIHMQPAGDERIAEILLDCFESRPDLQALWQ